MDAVYTNVPFGAVSCSRTGTSPADLKETVMPPVDGTVNPDDVHPIDANAPVSAHTVPWASPANGGVQGGLTHAGSMVLTKVGPPQFCLVSVVVMT